MTVCPGVRFPQLVNGSMPRACRPRSIAPFLSVILLAGIGASPSFAQTQLDTKYTITMTGVTIGQLAWTLALTEKDYETQARGKASGLFSVLLSGEASLLSRGEVIDGRLAGSQFQSRIQDDDGNSDIRMMLSDGAVTDLIVKGPPPRRDITPVKEADRHNIADPLTAMLFASNGGGDPLSPATCNRTLAIFDGAHRYNLALSFKRRDKVDVGKSYAGPVLVCGMTLIPISGHKSDSAIVKYVAKKDDLEMWLAPIAGTSLAVPIRFRAPTLLGTLEIRADRFEVVAQPAPTPSDVPR